MECADKATKLSQAQCLADLVTPPKVSSDAGRKVGAVRPPIINPAWSIPAWHVNFSTGDNNNTCTTVGSPCKTLGEVVSRWGTDAPQISVAVGIFVHADDTTNWTTIQPHIVNGGGLWIVFDTVTVSSGTLASVAAKDPTRGTVPELNANIGGAAAGSQGLQIVNSTRGNSVAWIDSVAGSVVTITQPENPNAPSPPTVPLEQAGEVNTWTSGDSFTTRRPVKLQLNRLCSESSVGDSAGDQQFIFVENGELFDPVSPTAPSTLGACAVLFAQTRIDPLLSLLSSVNLSSLANSWSPGGGLYANAVIDAGALGTLQVPLTGVTLSSVVITSDTIVHGDVAIPQGNELEFDEVDSASFEALGVTIGGQLEINTHVYGSTSWRVLSHGSLTYAGTAPNAFPGGNMTLGFQDVGGSFVQFGSAFDRTTTPGQWRPARAITPASLAASIASGGFGGTAYGDGGGVITDGVQATAAPATYVAAVANGGLGTGTPCPSGQVPVSNGTSYASCILPGTGSGTLTNASVSGTGNWHSVSGTLQTSASLGTALESLYTNSTATDEVWATIGGDVSLTTLTGTSGNGGAATYTVTGLEGTPVASTTPTAGQQLAFSSGAWRPTTGVVCPINLASCVTGALPTANGGLNRTTICPANQVPVSDGVSSYATCAPPGLGTLTALSVTGTGNWHAVSGALQSTASLGNAFQSLYTNSAATDVVWSNVTGDIALVSLSGTNGTSGNAHYLVVGLDGTPVAGAVPNAGDVLGFSAGAWRPTTLAATLPASGSSHTNTTVPATGVITDVGQDSITAPTGGAILLIWTSFQVSNPDTGPFGAAQNITVGIGVDTTSSFTYSQPFTAPFNLGSDPSVGAVSLNLRVAVLAGSHTVHALASSTTQTFTVGANNILLLH